MAEKTFHSITLPGQDTARVPLTAAEFSTSVAYKVKDYCTYQGKLYRCTIAHAAGVWNAEHFTPTDVDAEFDRKLDIPASQASAPANPRVGDLWIDNDENSPIYNVDVSPTLGSTNAVQSGGTKVALNSLDSRKMEHGVITGDFSASVDYRVGDLVFHTVTDNGITRRTLYRCITDHDSTDWNSAHFTPTTLEVELQKIRDSEADTDMIGDLFGAKSTYAIGDYCIYNDNLYRCIQAVDNTGVATPAFDPDDWTQVALANDVSDLNRQLSDVENALDAIETISIDGYARTYIDVEGTLTNNAFWDNTNKPVQINGYSYLTVACTPGSTYLISGTGSTAARLYTVLDSNGAIIDIASSAQTVRFDNVKYKAPSDSATIIVNAQNAQGAPSVQEITWNFAKTDGDSPIGIEKSTDVWEIGTGDFKTLVDLHGSANGTFNYTRILYRGNIFKTAGDDVAPLSLLSAGYVGANHGFIFVYDITATAHGLSTSDIGRTCEIDGDTWVLVKVIDPNTIEVACLNSNVWFGIKRVTTVPSTFDFGKTITVESSVLAQLLPSAKNISVSVSKNTAEVFEVLESYDIIDPSVGIAWIIANVGSATNDSVVEHSDSALTLRNLYQFDKYGACVVTQSVKANKAIGLEFYSGSQSQAFGVTDYYCVPKTTFASLRDILETQYFDRISWVDTTEPPKVFLQTNGSVSNANSMMLSGIELTNRNDAIASTAGFVYGSSRKMYPYAIQPNKALSIGDVYSFITYRIPMRLYGANKTLQYAGWCKVGKKYYVFAFVVLAVKASLELPKEMQGLQAKTIYSEYMTLKNEYVVNALDLESTRQGSILIELS